MPRSWRDYSPAEIDRAVERQHDRALARYEARVDRLAEEQEWCSVHRCPKDSCECDRPFAEAEDREVA